MKTTLRIGWAAAVLSMATPGLARSEAPPPLPTATAPQPPSQAPKDQPPTPPAPPAIPRAQPLELPPTLPPPAPQPPPPAPPSGQWVYTTQYGWLWMPYGQPYTHVVEDDGLAYTFVFYPRFGWRWVVAPWVFGLGPVPFWGAPGPLRFEWYARPWFRFGGPYRGWRTPHGPFIRGPAIPPGHRHH